MMSKMYLFFNLLISIVWIPEINCYRNFNHYSITTIELPKSSNQLCMAGFGKPKEVTGKPIITPSSDSLCSCGSNKKYENCCQSIHNDVFIATNPVQVVRARFSALCYGLIPYLIRTTHPDNKIYVPDDNSVKIGSKKTRRSIWEKEVKAFSEAYDFRNLVFEDEVRDSSPPSDAVDTTVSIKLERKLKNEFKWDSVEEITKFRRNTDDNSWNVLSAELKIRPANQKMVRTSQEDQFKS